MSVNEEQVRAMAAAIGLRIPEEELGLVAERLASIIAGVESIEQEYGPELDYVDPVPSVVVDETALR